MIRKSMKMLLCALLAAFTLSSIAEAAPKKVLRHRTKHSSRVASGSGSAAAAEKPAAKKKTPATPAAKKKSGIRKGSRSPLSATQTEASPMSSMKITEW